MEKMSEGMTVVTKISPSYLYSSEFTLALKMFKAAFPEGTSFFISEENMADALRDLVRDHIPDVDGYTCVVKEPAVLIEKDTVGEMLKVMRDHPDISCVLPSDIRGSRPGRAPNYYTMRGFEKFAESLYDPDNAVAPYDGREPWMFIVRSEFLRSIEIPENPVTIPCSLPPDNVCISLNAYIHPFIDYYKETRSDVLPYLPKAITSLLDIGCTRGYFGEAVKKERGCKVVGIEINFHEAQEAKSRLDRVIEGDIFAVDIGEKFDCITCLDVVEHFVQPDEFLLKVKTLLQDNAHLILSVPNVGHWAVVEDLIAGRWDYIPAGTLCVSHVRFFTKATVESLLRGNGFRIVATGEELTPLPDTVAKSIDLLKQAGLEVDEKSLAALRYYIVAQVAVAQRE